MLSTKQDFTVVAVVVGTEPYEINGLNIWDHEWKNTGERLLVQDDGSGRSSTHMVKEISFDGKVAQFVADEFSNGVWKLYHRY